MLHRIRRDRGQDLVEFALVLPLLLLLVVGIVEFALIIFSYNTIGDAAREGARYGIIHPTDSGGIEAAARRLTSGLDPAELTVTPSLPPGESVIRVEVTYQVHLLSGLVEILGGVPSLTLRAVSTMQIE